MPIRVALHGKMPYMYRRKEFVMVSASSRQTQHRETKRERMELRVATSAKTLIKRAMAVSGMTAGDLRSEERRVGKECRL